MKHLREKKYIIVADDGHISLTDSGRAIAEMVFERHQLLTLWMTRMGVPEEIAAEDAC